MFTNPAQPDGTWMDYEPYPGPGQMWSEYDLEAALTEAVGRVTEQLGIATGAASKVLAGVMETLTEALRKPASSTDYMLVNHYANSTESVADLVERNGFPDKAQRLREVAKTTRRYPTSAQPWERRRR